MTASNEKPAMDVLEIAPGLWRWTAPHPDWTPAKDKPGGWGQMVGCVFYDPLQARPGGAGGSEVGTRVGARSEREGAGFEREGARFEDDASPKASQGAVVLIDPLAPPEGTADATRFWAALDRDIERSGAPVAILIANEYHSRSAQEVHDRYRARRGAGIWAHASAVKDLSCKVTDPFEEGRRLPSGVTAHSIAGLTDGGRFHIPAAPRSSSPTPWRDGRGRARVVPAAPDTPKGSADTSMSSVPLSAAFSISISIGCFSRTALLSSWTGGARSKRRSPRRRGGNGEPRLREHVQDQGLDSRSRARPGASRASPPVGSRSKVNQYQHCHCLDSTHPAGPECAARRARLRKECS
jgi:hypothetical protein